MKCDGPNVTDHGCVFHMPGLLLPVTATECVTPEGHPYTTSYDTCPPPITAEVAVRPAERRELPVTGGTLDMALLGAAALVAGLWMRLRARTS